MPAFSPKPGGEGFLVGGEEGAPGSQGIRSCSSCTGEKTPEDFSIFLRVFQGGNRSPPC